MPTMIKCDGCGIEINKDIDNVHPQGPKENYCRVCNKVYPKFLSERSAIWNKYDKLKWDETSDMRKRIFGKAKPVEEVKEETADDIKSRVGK